jgi:phosphoenolpyruvate carboxykinase (ATP)
VPADILDPANTWGSREEYFRKYDALAARFIENFKVMAAGCPPGVVEHGPKRLTGVPARA